MKKYMFTGRSVRFTEAQQELVAKQYVSLRKLAKDNGVELSRLLYTMCSPDPHGGLNNITVVLGTAKDMTKGRNGKNEAMQILNTMGDAVQILRYDGKHLTVLKQRGAKLNVNSLFNRLAEPVTEMKLALVQRQRRDDFAGYLPCTEPGTVYGQMLHDAIRKVVMNMRSFRLEHLVLVADRWNRQLETLLWIAGQTETTVTFTWIDSDGIAETHDWLQPMELRSFLSLYTDLNVYRYTTLDEHGQRVTRWSRPDPSGNEPTPYYDFSDKFAPVIHDNDEPATFEERMEELGIDADKIVSYDQMQEAAYACDENGDLDDSLVQNVRRHFDTSAGFVKEERKIDYAPHIVCKAQHCDEGRDSQYVAPRCARATGRTVDPETLQQLHTSIWRQ
jgi:hypothetical protein